MTPDSWVEAKRLGGLRRFAIAITVLNLLGHTVFGFEQSWLQPFASLAAAYCCEIFIEFMEARAEKRKPHFLGGWRKTINFLLPAHITGLACAMLLYPSDHLLPIMFASSVAVASKTTFRIRAGDRLRHFLNPSNFGIAVTLLLFPWVSIAPPYHFTENLGPLGDWLLPAVIICSGTLLNFLFTKRLPLIVAWWGGFAAQALIMHFIFDAPILASLNPMTGVAFILFSFYMITDPATTPYSVRGQIGFGIAVAAVYGLLISLHIAFGLFFSLALVSGMRGVLHYALRFQRQAEVPLKVARTAATVQRHAS